MRIKLILALSAIATLSYLATQAGAAGPLVFADKAELGQALFSDTDLSANRTQSCATCHIPDMGFTDHRETEAGKAVSLGDDGHSLGDRSAPTAAYAAFTPPFHRNEKHEYVGGQFWDGRASTLEDQAGGPPLNPIEMGLPDKAAVAARIEENPDYVAAFKAHFGPDVFNDPGKTYAAMQRSIAAFERTDTFSPFDSKYDRYLRGEVKLTDQEELGRTLFFSTQFTNCNLCHEIKGADGRFEGALFTNHKYFNIGVPANKVVRKLNGTASDFRDLGLAQNPLAKDDETARGRFKVPTLRNVAVSGPYMHNGVFTDLRTVILFYNKYNSKKKSRQINPETGARWAEPEVAENLARTELETGPGLDDQRIDALVAFLGTLTDKRYEHLLAGR